MITGKHVLEIIGLVTGTGLLTYVYQGLIKLNALENKIRDTLGKINAIDDLINESRRLKIEGAFCKHRVKDMEKYLQKGGYHPRDIDEDSFL